MILTFAILKLVNYIVPCTSSTYNKRELFPLKKMLSMYHNFIIYLYYWWWDNILSTH